MKSVTIEILIIYLFSEVNVSLIKIQSIIDGVAFYSVQTNVNTHTHTHKHVPCINNSKFMYQRSFDDFLKMLSLGEYILYVFNILVSLNIVRWIFLQLLPFVEKCFPEWFSRGVWQGAWNVKEEKESQITRTDPVTVSYILREKLCNLITVSERANLLSLLYWWQELVDVYPHRTANLIFVATVPVFYLRGRTQKALSAREPRTNEQKQILVRLRRRASE